MAWDKFDFLNEFVGKEITYIEKDYGNGKMILHIDGGEIQVTAVGDGRLEVKKIIRTHDEYEI